MLLNQPNLCCIVLLQCFLEPEQQDVLIVALGSRCGTSSSPCRRRLLMRQTQRLFEDLRSPLRFLDNLETDGPTHTHQSLTLALSFDASCSA